MSCNSLSKVAWLLDHPVLKGCRVLYKLPLNTLQASCMPTYNTLKTKANIPFSQSFWQNPTYKMSLYFQTRDCDCDRTRSEGEFFHIYHTWHLYESSRKAFSIYNTRVYYAKRDQSRSFLRNLFPVHEDIPSRGSVVVTALCYKPEDRGFETRWGEWISFNLPNPSGWTRLWGLLGF
jgi:hypothetical protein